MRRRTTRDETSSDNAKTFQSAMHQDPTFICANVTSEYHVHVPLLRLMTLCLLAHEKPSNTSVPSCAFPSWQLG